MATITLTIPDAVIDRVRDAIAANNGYNAVVHGTKAQFAKTWIIRQIKNQVNGYEIRVAADTASQTAGAAAESEIVIT